MKRLVNSLRNFDVLLFVRVVLFIVVAAVVIGIVVLSLTLTNLKTNYRLRRSRFKANR